MKKQFITLGTLLLIGITAAYAQLEKIKPGKWQMAQPPARLDGNPAPPNALYTILQISHGDGMLNLQASTIRSDGQLGVEEMQLSLGDPYVGKSPSGRKSISVLTYDREADRFKLHRAYYTVADDTKLEFTMDEELWYDEKGYLQMTRVVKAQIPDYGARDYDAKAWYALREE